MKLTGWFESKKSFRYKLLVSTVKALKKRGHENIRAEVKGFTKPQRLKRVSDGSVFTRT